jgi:hypothetical protein
MVGVERGYVDGFDLRLEVVLVDDRVVLRSVGLTASEGATPNALSKSTWSSVGMPELYDVVDRFLTTTGSLRTMIPPALRKAAERPRPGRRGRPDLFYAERVAQFVRALDEEPDTPIRWLVEHVEWPVAEPKPRTGDGGRRWSRDDAKSKQWRAWLAEAKKRGLLADRPDGLSGRTGGRMTKKCERLLARTNRS